MTSETATDDPSGARYALTQNNAGGLAYRLEDREALAQMAATGCLKNTFHASRAHQLEAMGELAAKLDPAFVAKVAIYSRKRGFMKEAPAFLLSLLCGRLAHAARAKEAAHRTRDPGQAALLGAEVRQLSAIVRDVFPRVIDNGKMLRAFVRYMRGGEAGRASLGSMPRKLVAKWLEGRSPDELFVASVGNRPSLGDVIALAHPVPRSREQAALFGYLRDRETCTFQGEELVVAEALPGVARGYESFKQSQGAEVPPVPYEMLEGVKLSGEQWKQLAMQASWQQTRQHLAVFLRHGVFRSEEVTRKIAEKLADKALIRKARAMPYQLLVAYLNAEDLPPVIRGALQQAAEIAIENVPVVDGLVAVFPDISGSMRSPVTGEQVNARSGALERHTTRVQCIDVAALVAAAVLRKNPQALVVPFSDHALTKVKLDPRASILENARKLASLPSGGTNCSAALKAVLDMGLAPDLVWYVSDNESWVDCCGMRADRTATRAVWERVRARNPRAKMVCLDLQPNTSTQLHNRPDVMNVGGFSDIVFDAVAAFHCGVAGSWVEMIENSVDWSSQEPTLPAVRVA